MNERKIAFIICSHQKRIREEILKYINKLNVPIGFEIEVLIIEDAKGMAEGYNRAMKKSDAKFKVYMHHDVFVINTNLLNESLGVLLANSKIGILGVIGCKRVPKNGIWWESNSCIGKTMEDNLECLRELNLGEVERDFEEVQALDGQFLITQYDIIWREDICQGWHFYDTSQCLEFAKAGYVAAVVKQNSPWLIHECGTDINTGYEIERERFIREYKLLIENRNYSIEEQIGSLINVGEYSEAKELLVNYKESAIYNDNMAIFEASILQMEGKDEETFLTIGKGLSYNCKNYELYFMLGNYYRERNKNQAYLCYENALYYCNNEDREYIAGVMEELSVSENIDVKPVAVVVLSYNNIELTKLCLESLRYSIPKSAGEIIVIDNASTDGSADWLLELNKSEDSTGVHNKLPNIKIQCNKVNTGFPAGCNQGIVMSEPDYDIFLLNNDTIVPPNAIFSLRMGLYENEKVGATGSVSNHANNDQMVKGQKGSPEGWYQYAEEHNVPIKYPYEKKAWLMGFAVMFRRGALEKIGYLDERFSPGNYEDNDIGYRLLKEGYQQLLCKNSFIFHFGSIGFRKNQKAFDELLNRNRRKLAEKFGFEIDRYSWIRTDMLELIHEEPFAKLNILEVDCGMGATIAKANYLYPESLITGIEKEEKAVEFGRNLAHILCGDIRTMELPFEANSFDYILIENAIDYMEDIKQVLNRLAKKLKHTGCMILSISKMYQGNGKTTIFQKDKLESIVSSCSGLKMEWLNKDSNIDYYLKIKLSSSKL